MSILTRQYTENGFCQKKTHFSKQPNNIYLRFQHLLYIMIWTHYNGLVVFNLHVGILVT